ncbi:MAG: hypothetical protein U0903_16465 [Planctomycetales bacterium]
MLRIGWLGNWSRSEFLALQREGLEETTPFSGEFLPDGQELLSSLRDASFPDLMLVAQSWPDEYSPHTIDRLIRLAPLTRWICCYGAWCDADGRTRDLWPPGCRVPAWRFLPRLRQELRALSLGDISLLPLTGSREEIFAQDYASSPFQSALTVRVDSPDRTYADFLSHLCRSWGMALNPSAPDLILFDLDPECDPRAEACLRLRQEFPQATILGLRGFSHSDQETVWKSRGVSRVVSKLSPLSELANLIGNLQPTV